MHSSICSNYILKAQQNNNVHEEKRTKDTEGPTFFLNQLFLAASVNPFKFRNKKTEGGGGDGGGVGPNKKGPLKLMPQEWICIH